MFISWSESLLDSVIPEQGHIQSHFFFKPLDWKLPSKDSWITKQGILLRGIKKQLRLKTKQQNKTKHKKNPSIFKNSVLFLLSYLGARASSLPPKSLSILISDAFEFTTRPLWMHRPGRKVVTWAGKKAVALQVHEVENRVF